MELQENIRHRVLRAAAQILRPVVALLLRSGITWKEFSDVAKRVFVRVATEDYGRKGRPTNLSRVAILTGLSRRDVAAQRKQLADTQTINGGDQISFAARVLSGWHQDEDFLNQDGKPAKLQRLGNHPSLESLLKRYAGDIPPVALFKELLNVNAIRENADGTIEALSRFYMPVSLDDKAVVRAGSVWQDLGETINYNLTREVEQSSRFEGRATNTRLSPKAVKALYQLIEEKGEALLEETDQWLSDHETDDEGDGIRAGIGIYLIEESRRK